MNYQKAQEGTKSGAGDDFEDEAYIGLPVRAGASQGLKEIGFHVPGAVTGKMRARIGRMGAYTRMFTPEKTVVYENLVKFHAARAMQTESPIAGPVQVNMLIGVAVPASWSKKKQAAALAGELFPTSKPDLDNSIKSVFDAMNGVVYKDDAQVVNTVTKKRYREAPGLWVTVFALGDANV